MFMRFPEALFVVVLCTAVFAQESSRPALPPQPKFVAVPLTLSHNLIVIDVDIPSSNGATQHVHAWVDNGNPDLYISRRLVELLGGSISCEGQLCSTTPPVEMNIGGMTIALGGRIPGAAIKLAKVPASDAPIAPGLNVDINIPSTILRSYDVLIDFPGHKFTIGQPGSLKFNGVKAKAIVNGANGLIQVPSEIERKKYNLGLDLGSSISFLLPELYDKLAAVHPDWPQMTGAIGPANMRGSADEAQWKLMRVDRVQYGPLYLTSVPVASFPKDRMADFETRAGIPTAGLLGAEALANYRIGLDYAHSAIYFDIGRTFNFPDFDVVGLILRPEGDGRFTVVAIAEYDGKASVPDVQAGDELVAVDGIPVHGSTLGQVWLMLGGEPGKERSLTVERAGKQFAVAAPVRHFLSETDAGDTAKPRSRKH